MKHSKTFSLHLQLQKTKVRHYYIGLILYVLFFSDIHFMPCSGLTGANIKDELDPSVCKWYK